MKKLILPALAALLLLAACAPPGTIQPSFTGGSDQAGTATVRVINVGEFQHDTLTALTVKIVSSTIDALPEGKSAAITIYSAPARALRPGDTVTVRRCNQSDYGVSCYLAPVITPAAPG